MGSGRRRGGLPRQAPALGRLRPHLGGPVRQLHELQKHLGTTKLLIIDEISMVGRQMMGRMDARCTQATAGKNPKEHSLGGISCVGVGDPAQCEAIMDQQIYDVHPHKKTTTDGDTRSVLL